LANTAGVGRVCPKPSGRSGSGLAPTSQATAGMAGVGGGTLLDAGGSADVVAGGRIDGPALPLVAGIVHPTISPQINAATAPMMTLLGTR
jgi:hypothetical protein